MVGEGYRKVDENWYRYCDLGPVDQYMNEKVSAWMPMPKAPKKRAKQITKKNSVNFGALEKDGKSITEQKKNEI